MRSALLGKLKDNFALAGANPFACLCDVIAKLAGDWLSARIAELMPAAWAAAQTKAEASQTAVG